MMLRIQTVTVAQVQQNHQSLDIEGEMNYRENKILI